MEKNEKIRRKTRHERSKNENIQNQANIWIHERNEQTNDENQNLHETNMILTENLLNSVLL